MYIILYEKINEKILKIWKIEEFQKNDAGYWSNLYRHYFQWGPAPILWVGPKIPDYLGQKVG